MICDAHIHVGRYYRMTDAATFARSDFYYEPKVVLNTRETIARDNEIRSSIRQLRPYGQ